MRQVGWLFVVAAVAAMAGTASAVTAATAGSAAAAPLVRVLSLTIKPGKQAVFEAFVAQYRSAYVARGGGRGWQMASTVLGEDPIYTAAFAFSDWTELAPQARNVMVEEYGAEAAQAALANYAEAVVNQRSAVYRYLPAYSREPPAGFAVATLQANVIIDLKPSKVAQYLTALELVREARIRADSPAFWRVYAGSLGAQTAWSSRIESATGVPSTTDRVRCEPSWLRHLARSGRSRRCWRWRPRRSTSNRA